MEKLSKINISIATTDAQGGGMVRSKEFESFEKAVDYLEWVEREINA